MASRVFDNVKGYNCKQDRHAPCTCVPYYLLWKTDTKVTANVLKIRMQKCRVLRESIINGNNLVRRSRKHRLVEVLVKQRTK